MAVLEVPRQQREADQQREQVGEDHPLLDEVKPQSEQTRLPVEIAEEDFESHDCGKARERDGQRVAMKQSHTQQRQSKEDELDRDAHCERGACAAITPPLTASAIAAMSGAR